MRYRKEIEVARPPEETFRYLADFSNAAEWDPGIAEARKLSEGPVGKGTRFEVVALFRGNRQTFAYVVTDYEENRRIVLDGDGEKARSLDRVTVEPAAGGSRVSYDADIRLKGLYRVAEPFLGRTMARMGDDALAGLEAKLGRPA